jgi:hypothetical protein
MRQSVRGLMPSGSPGGLVPQPGRLGRDVDVRGCCTKLCRHERPTTTGYLDSGIHPTVIPFARYSRPMIFDDAISSADSVPWSAIFGTGGTLIGAAIGGALGVAGIRTQIRAETQRQKDRMEAEQTRANTEWVRAQRVQGYVDFLQVIDHYLLWSHVSSVNPATGAELRKPSREAIQAALSLVALYGPDSVRDKAAAVNELAGSYQLNPALAVSSAFNAARDEYIAEVRQHLSVT